MESFFRTHKYLVEHVQSPVRRELMDEIAWHNRLIGIKGSRGVGKTTFLLQYAKERYGTNRKCLYINLNSLYFTERTLTDFAEEFYLGGGRVLLIDQVYKYPQWAEDLKTCYERFPQLQIVFSGSSVMRLKEDNALLADIVDSYNLRGYSFREYFNLMTGKNYHSITLEDLLKNHRHYVAEITKDIDIKPHFNSYIHHGYYPFFLEKRNFSENLMKTVNMMLEVDVVFLKQIELTYLPKIRKLLYLLAVNAPYAPNVSQLAIEIKTSRATVVNYLKYLKDARLINMLYPEGEEFPKKPARVYMQNTNLMYPITQDPPTEQALRETFFYNTLHKGNRLNTSGKGAHFLVNGEHRFDIQGETIAGRNKHDRYYVLDTEKTTKENEIPLWLFGFLY